ncbi:MAG: SAM-dependent methyltransferase, partial [Desulfovibrio sp.]
MNNIHHQCRGESPGRQGCGPTSFWLHNPEQVFEHLPMKPGMVLVDAGCGAGEYA